MINTTACEIKSNFHRRDHLKEIEAYVQSLWKENHTYEADPPESFLSGESTRDLNEKYFCTFPYPYMNGRLHLGHSFTLAKAEFQARYQRLLGKRVLWPLGFHCTGMPICACADKLREELNHGFEGKPHNETLGTVEQSDVTKFSGKKSKAVSKAGNDTSQISILLSCGVEESLIPQFVDASFWVSYFPLRGQNDLQRFGASIDWRRTFVTTSINPYYDAFIRWQFNVLKKRNFIAFGNRATVFSRVEGQACADHERLHGEGVGPQEYLGVKIRAQKVPREIEWIASKYSVFFIAATLRPETLYGQTNCFVLPTGEYGIYLALDERITKADNIDVYCAVMEEKEAYDKCHQVFICSERSALNMAYQGLLPVTQDANGLYNTICLGTITGDKLIGLPLSSPNTVYTTIYMLPMMTISLNKGTGIVTSVPSDSADDYAALKDLIDKPAFREKFGVTEEMISCAPLVPVIQIPSYGTMAAVEAYEKYKVKSQHDKEALAAIKTELYKKGYYDGIMLAGPYKGEKVSVVKSSIKNQLIDEKQAIVYFETEKPVITRKGDTCIVALCNQWYLDYGNPVWKDTILKYISDASQFNAYSSQCLNQLKHVVDWIQGWACSRKYGLGTYLPWEIELGNKVLIESLSDSTIYMAYYTIAHYLQGDMNGSKPGLMDIQAKELTDAVFDYIFMQTDTPPEACSISVEKLNVMRREFSYWYPMDLRVSGKDLIFNHLTMSLFNHVAIWPERRESTWPRGFYCNGHILIDAQKMSKSLGNFLTIDEAIETFTSDAIRIALADGGDSLDDANFQRDEANASIMKLFFLEKYAQEIVEATSKNEFRTEDKQWIDLCFENEIYRLYDQCVTSYNCIMYRNALKYGFYDFMLLKDKYRHYCGPRQVHLTSIMLWLELQVVLLSPIAPHICEYIWKEHLKKPKLLSQTPYIQLYKNGTHNIILHRQYNYFNSIYEEFRSIRDKTVHSKNSKLTAHDSIHGIIYVAKNYAPWQQLVLKHLQRVPLAPCQRKPLDNQYINEIRQNADFCKLDKKQAKQLLPFTTYKMKVELAEQGPQALEIRPPFNELDLLKTNHALLERLLDIKKLDIRYTDDQVINSLDINERKTSATPLKPSIVFYKA